MKSGYRKAMIEKYREEQDYLLYRNAVIRQKIASVVFCLAVIAFWAWIMASDCVCIWYAPLAIPAVIMGLGAFSKNELIGEKYYEGRSENV